ncbi:hypothetical protein CDD83_515 [Cordyceps sp. RAO-2017]|nr:hypothetical protein CDD83_515 [Cordyceps sp. RAO-2017]
MAQAANGPDLLPAFGSAKGEQWFRTAFKWKLNEIIKWLDDASNGRTGGPRSKDPDVQKLLKDALSKIKALASPNGTNYTNPEPKSHFPRSVNGDWSDSVDKKTVSRFKLHEWPGIYRRGPKDAELRVPYWNPYDLLGLFLSLLGPAPVEATKSNYFLPLTAVYARWCARIAGKAPPAYKYPDGEKGTGAGNWPFMFQCTWHDDRSKKPLKWFFLGASISGDEFKEDNVGAWKRTVQLHRFNMMYACFQVKMLRTGDFENQRAPEQRIAGGSQVPFGNCAETYPFVEKMFRDKVKNTELYGLALKRDFMRDINRVQEYDGSPQGVIWGNLVGPCRNCATLIKWSGGVKENFGIEVDEPRAAQGQTDTIGGADKAKEKGAAVLVK